MAALKDRRDESASRLAKLREALLDTEPKVGNNACVYITGSFARGEATSSSDLDLFIAGREIDGKRQLSQLNEICVKADLIDATRAQRIPDFSGDGMYLVHYTAKDLTETLGHPNDDAKNTFTARLLLLLESKALLGADYYYEVVSEVIAAYWKDFADHKSDFAPSFLTNDILRLWRTFCVNYEARTERETDEKKAKRKLKNFKLKHSRLLTCYSGVAFLLAVHTSNNTVSPQDAIDMAKMSPTERLEWIKSQDNFPGAEVAVDKILGTYSRFLDQTSEGEKLLQKFRSSDESKLLFQQANELGDGMYELLSKLGHDSRFFRQIVV